MSGGTAVDLNAVVDGQRLRGRLILFIVLAALAMASDGYDLATMGYMIPEVIRQSHLSRTALVPAISAGIVGMMIGGPLFGALGERYGRKPMTILGLCIIGLLDLVAIRIFEQMMVAGEGIGTLAAVRFVIGLAVGGVFPNIAALIAELTPRRARARVLVLVALGVVLGIAVPGLVANGLVPHYGWKAILVVGSALPVAVAVAIAIWLPESIKYLAGRVGREAQVLRLGRLLRPDLGLADDSRFALGSATIPVGQGRTRQLFAGALTLVTPMLWICQATNQMANSFSLTWLPAILQAGHGGHAAGSVAALFPLGGLAAGVLLLFVIDRLGVLPMVAMFLIGAPLIAQVAATDLSPAAHAAVIAGAGFCVTGIQCGITALLGLLYPTAIRSLGTGWTQSAGRLGMLAAPLIGGLLLDIQIPLDRLPLAPAVLLVIGGIACVVLTIACRREFGGYGVEEFALVKPAAAMPVDPVAGTI